MNDSNYILYELACDCIGIHISKLSAQLADARHKGEPNPALIDALKRDISLLWIERHELSWRDDAAVEACLLAYSARPDRIPELIAGVHRMRANDELLEQ